MKHQCPEKCGRNFISQAFAEKHANEAHLEWRTPKSKGWRTPWGFIDFAFPVTYEYACKMHKEALPELEAMMAGRD